MGLFFVLSGFILAYTYFAKSIRLRDFWSARFARVYPIFFLGLLLVAPGILAKVALHLDSSRELLNGIAALFLLQAWFPSAVLSWNAPGWSLSVEAFFYLLFPLLLLKIRPWSRRRLFITMFAMWGAALVVPAVCILCNVEDFRGVLATDVPSGYVCNFVKFNPLLRLPEFVIGMLLGALFLSRGTQDKANRPNGAYFYLPGLIILLLVCSVLSSRIPYPFIHNGALIGCEALLIYGLAVGGGWLDRILTHPWLVRLGEASYAIYILHVPLDDWMRRIDKMTLNLALSHGTPMFIVYLATVIAVSLLTYRWIEEPAREYLRSRLSAETRLH